MSSSDELSPHRLFAAIVLMGTGLAAGCGGIAEGDRQVAGGGSSSSAGTGTGSSSNVGASTGVGGATTSSTGGTFSAGAPPVLNTAGSTPLPSSVDPGPFACPTEQWSCASKQCDGLTSGWTLPATACDCDPRRPLKASDCKPGQVFVCQNVTQAADGRPLTKPVALACSCVQKAEYFCASECDAAYGERDLSCSGSPDELSALCGCAVVYLK
jgi:hypothetical protein